jgi:hypothetical protein
MLAATAPTPDLIANAKQLQQLEAELYSTMEDINKANPQATDTQQKLLKRIADVNVTKQQVFKLIEERYLDANANLSHDKLALGSQIEILQIAEEQLAAASQNITALRDYHSTQERLAGMDEYEFERISADNTMAYTAFLGLAAVAVELFIVNMLPGILAKRNPGNSWKPSGTFSSIMTGVLALTVVVTLVRLGKQFYDASGRSNLVYSEYTFGGMYDHPSGADAPGATVIQHDKLFFEKLGGGLKDDVVQAGRSLATATGAATAAAKKGLSGKNRYSMPLLPPTDNLPISAVAHPALSAGGLRQTPQKPIEGAPPVGVVSSTIENFATF